jgi:hypothetical protein
MRYASETRGRIPSIARAKEAGETGEIRLQQENKGRHAKGVREGQMIARNSRKTSRQIGPIA